MPTLAVPSSAASGQGLVDAIRLPETRLNLLFAALLTTAGGGFLGGNLLLLDAAVFERSGLVALACLAVLAIFYTLARSLGSPIRGLALTYLLLWAMTAARQPWLVTLFYACATCALLYTLRFLRVSRRHWGSVLLMGIIGAAAAFSSPLETTFDMLHRLPAGNVHRDALYHAGIAAMIKNYGVVSTGLHGLVETPYHILSHTLVAGLSLLSGRGVFEVYGVAPAVLFIPILIFSAVAGAALLDRTGRLDLPTAWGLVCLLLVVTPRLLSPWLFWESYLVSASYMIALGLFLLGFPLLFKTRLRVSDLLLIPLIAALMAETKVSVGLLFAGLWLVRLLLIPGERPVLERIVTPVALVATAVVAARATLGGMSEWITAGPHNILRLVLNFVHVFPFGDAWTSEVMDALRAENQVPWHILILAALVTLSFLVAHFSFSWLLIGRAVYRQGIAALWKDPVALYSFATVISGAAAVFSFYIPGLALYYFSNIAFFVALPTVATLATERLHRWRVRDTTLLFLGIALIVLASLRSYYRASAFASVPAPPRQSAFVESLLRVRDHLPLHIALQPHPSLLRDNPIRPCDAQPFIFPAISERPWLQVIPQRDDCYYQYYGYEQYGITDARQAVTVEARLLPEMEIRHWPPASQCH